MDVDNAGNYFLTLNLFTHIINAKTEMPNKIDDLNELQTTLK